MAMFDAARTISGIRGYEQLKGGAPQALQTRRIGIYYHSLRHLFSTSGDGLKAAFDVHEAEPTRASRLFCLANGAKVGHINTGVQGCPKDLFALSRFDGFAINGQIDRIHIVL
jgi:hypothetical protein